MHLLRLRLGDHFDALASEDRSQRLAERHRVWVRGSVEFRSPAGALPSHDRAHLVTERVGICERVASAAARRLVLARGLVLQCRETAEPLVERVCTLGPAASRNNLVFPPVPPPDTSPPTT